MERKGNNQQGEKPTKRPADEGVAVSLSNKELKSDSGHASMENESKPGFDKPTLEKISMNRQALEDFVDRLEMEVLKENNVGLVGLLAVASVRLERLCFDVTRFFEFGNRKRHFEPQKDEYPIPDDIMEGDVVTIPISDRHSMRKVPLYIRQNWVDRLSNVKSFVNNDLKRKLYVTGAQGCGKTCFLWMWARMLMKQGRRVLSIRYQKMDVCALHVLEDGATWQLTPPVGAFELVETVTALMKAQTRQFDVCICDGMQTNDIKCSMLMSVLNINCEGMKQPGAKICKLVLGTKLLFRIPLCDEMTGEDSVVATMTLDSWQEADYEKAAQSDLMKDPKLREMLLKDLTELTSDFPTGDGICCGDKESESTEQPGDADKLMQAVRLKLYYAGGCARYMFGFSFDQLTETVQEYIGDISKWALNGTTNDYVDNVMQLCYGKRLMRVPVSKYVLLLADEHGRSGLANMIKSVAWETGSSLLNGWALELNQFQIIRAALEANKYTRAMVVDSSCVTFCPRAETEFTGSTIYGEVASGTVIWSSHHQGCFDAAFYFDSTVVTLQFAATGPNLLKVRCMKPFRIALLEKGVDVKRMVHVVIGEGLGESFLREATSQWQGNGANNSDAAIRVEVMTSLSLRQILTSKGVNSIQPRGTTNEIYFS